MHTNVSVKMDSYQEISDNKFASCILHVSADELYKGWLKIFWKYSAIDNCLRLPVWRP